MTNQTKSMMQTMQNEIGASAQPLDTAARLSRRKSGSAAAEAAPAKGCRFTAMCVPGEDDSDTNWYVYDLVLRRSDKVGAGPQSRSLAVWMAREANRVQNERE